jgi:hypothetical protein
MIEAKAFLITNANQKVYAKAGNFNAALRMVHEVEGTRGPRVKHTYEVRLFDCAPEEVVVTDTPEGPRVDSPSRHPLYFKFEA